MVFSNCSCAPWLGIGLTAEKRNGHPSRGCRLRMEYLSFLTKPKSQGRQNSHLSNLVGFQNM